MKGIFVNHMIDKIIILPLSVLNPKLSKYHDYHKKSLKWSASQVLANTLKVKNYMYNKHFAVLSIETR